MPLGNEANINTPYWRQLGLLPAEQLTLTISVHLDGPRSTAEVSREIRHPGTADPLELGGIELVSLAQGPQHLQNLIASLVASALDDLSPF